MEHDNLVALGQPHECGDAAGVIKTTLLIILNNLVSDFPATQPTGPRLQVRYLQQSPV